MVIQDIVREEERPNVRSGPLDNQAPESTEDDMELESPVSYFLSLARGGKLTSGSDQTPG